VSWGNSENEPKSKGNRTRNPADAKVPRCNRGTRRIGSLFVKGRKIKSGSGSARTGKPPRAHMRSPCKVDFGLRTGLKRIALGGNSGHIATNGKRKGVIKTVVKRRG